MGSLDWLSTDNKKALEILPIEERALMPNGLPHELSIKDIAALSDPENKLKQEMTIKTLVDLCKAGRLHYYGDINGWSYREDMLNPFPNVTKGGDNFGVEWWGNGPEIPKMIYRYSWDCLINRDSFKLYLQSVNIWPVNGLLANWWTESEPQAEAVKGYGVNSQDDKEPATPKVVKAPRDDSRFSGLLNNPKKIDNWFEAIDDMTKDFYGQFTKIPNDPQAWGRLRASPPDGYTITNGKDKGEDCLFMPGIKPLSRSGFSKRWARYTANKAE